MCRSFFSSDLSSRVGPAGGVREGQQLRYLGKKPHVQAATNAPSDFEWGPITDAKLKVAEGHPRVGLVVGAPNPYSGPPNPKLMAGDRDGSWTVHMVVFLESHLLAGGRTSRPLEMFDMYTGHSPSALTTGPILDIQCYDGNVDVLSVTALTDIKEEWTRRGVPFLVICHPGEGVCKPQYLHQVGR